MAECRRLGTARCKEVIWEWVCPSWVWEVGIKHVHIKMFEELKSSVEMVECEKSVAFLKVFQQQTFRML
jgi:hypothetical protein